MVRSARPGARLTAVLLGVFSLAVPGAAQAPDGVTVTGTVTDAQALALPGTAVVLGTPGGAFVDSAITDGSGRYALAGVIPGEYVLRATLVGFAPRAVALLVAGARVGGQLDVPITLDVGAFTQEVTVSAVMPELATEFVVAAPDIERRVSQDLAQSLRSHAGVTSLRRGAINLDPSVRGLYAEQIGVFVDGTRTFAAGPARMDSGLSHVSPHALQAVRVVRGPYALTWGAGTLSAIRAETFKPAFSGGGMELGGRTGYNYGANGHASDAFASVYGSSDRIRFGVQHNTRTGNDYTAAAAASRGTTSRSTRAGSAEPASAGRRWSSMAAASSARTTSTIPVASWTRRSSRRIPTPSSSRTRWAAASCRSWPDRSI